MADSQTNETFGTRLFRALERVEATNREFADKIGVTIKTVGRYLDRDEPPNLEKKKTKETIKRICRTLAVRRAWLLRGEEPMLDNDTTPAFPVQNDGAKQKRNDSLLPPGDTIKVDHFGPAAAGDGRMLEPKGQVTLTRKEFTVRFGHRSPDQVGLFEVVGDSAVPVYYDGEDVPVEVKGHTQEFEQDTVYVFRYQKKDVMIKRLRRLDDDRIRAQSLNPGIDDQILYHHEHDFAILGRVIDNQKQQLYTSLMNRFLRRGNQQLPALE